MAVSHPGGRRVSFDLYVFDCDVPDDGGAIGELLEDDSRWDAPLSARLAAFVAELEARYPGLDDDPDHSPWASWPLSRSAMLDGRCVGVSIGWSYADRMSSEVRSLCADRGLTLYDPQAERVTRPSTAAEGAAKPCR
jgi:hypothetical protein